MELIELKYNNYTDLEITSTKKPHGAHLIWEVSTSLIYMTDDDNPEILLASDDKGTTWDIVATRTYSIVGGWHDRANNKIYFVDGYRSVPGPAGQDFTSWYITTTKGSENVTEMGSHNDANGFIQVVDIVKIDADFYIYGTNYIDATHLRKGFWKWVNPNWVFQTGFEEVNQTVVDYGPASYVFVESTTDVYFWSKKDVNIITIYKWVIGGGGTLTTLKTFASGLYTFPTDYNQNGIAYDGTDKFYMVLNRIADGENVLVYYSIMAVDATELGIYDISLMLDRNTVSGVLEKGFHVSEYKVYQLQEHTTQLYLIAVPDTGEVIIAITDNFFITTTGKMFEYEDHINSLISVHIVHEIMANPYALVRLKKDEILIEENMVMKFIANYTTAGATAEDIIFEGKIKTFTDTPFQTVILAGLGEGDLNQKPTDDYTVDSDGLITTIITDDFNYITVGTLTDGADLGVITIAGEITAEFIFDIMAYFENFIWYLTPTGKLYFNNGSIDTTENLSEANKVFHATPIKARTEYNKIRVKGAYIDGVQKTSGWIENIASQQIIGVKDKSFDSGFLDTNALCTTTATNLLVRLGKTPKIIKFNLQDETIGFMQPGETITFEFASEGIIISSDQYLIQKVVYNNQDIGYYTITDELI